MKNQELLENRPFAKNYIKKKEGFYQRLANNVYSRCN
mgnify:CR=1 FL=1